MIEKTASDSILLNYDEQAEYIHIEYLKPSKTEEFKEVWERALDIAEEYRCSYWLIDQRRQNIHPEDQNWMVNDWFPRSMKRAPFSEESPRYVALIESKNFFIQFSTERFVRENSGPGFIINVFDSIEKAEAWLDAL